MIAVAVSPLVRSIERLPTRPAQALRSSGEHGLTRVRTSFWPVMHAALAASLAWFFAHGVLGHAQPFFAPIAAAIALSSSHIGRSRRIVQMVIGVLLGIAIAEGLVAVFGTGATQLGVIVAATMLIALLFGHGFVGEGMMFVNQAAVSAVLVVTLRHSAVSGERAVDVLVGGATAFIVGVLLFPAQPLPWIWNAERAVLAALAEALEAIAARLRGGEPMEPGWTLATGQRIHELLGRVAAARATARVNVRVAPRRFAQRARVDAEDMRMRRLDLLANAVLSLVRATSGALDDDEPIPAALAERIVELAGALTRLAATRQPWPTDLIAEVHGVAAESIEQVQAERVSRAPVIGSILRSAARDVQALTMAAENTPRTAGEAAGQAVRAV